MNNRKRSLLSAPYIFWIIGFIILPLLTIVYYAFTATDGSFTLENVAAMLTDQYNLKALGLSVMLSALSTAICLLLAYPLAVCLRNLRMKRKSMIVYLFILPIWLNFMLQMVAISILIEDNGVMNMILETLFNTSVSIMSTRTAIVVGMVYDYFPFMLLPIYNAISGIDKELLDASADLGANSLETFGRITLPLSIKGVISGVTMVFIPAISDFAIAEMLGGGKVLLIGNVVELNFAKGYYNIGSGLAMVLMLFVLISMALTERRSASGSER